MPAYWMISNRISPNDGFGVDRGPLSYWVSEKGPHTKLKNWQQRFRDDFQAQLVAAADQFPLLEHLKNRSFRT